tara:strand:- start:290 stop:529 length:240 start_codon:yes stop_codon:yes gene_type:complete
MDKCANINSMTAKERTEKYTTRRNAELRGSIVPLLMDECTEKYIARRIAELRGETFEKAMIQEHPYIKRRLAELRKENK